MNNAQAWLFNNLQQWTPFSVLIVVAGIACIFMLCWDVITGQQIQPFIVGILTLVIGSSGTATLFQHGVNVANGVATSTAKATVTAVVEAQKSGDLPTIEHEEKRTP